MIQNKRKIRENRVLDPKVTKISVSKLIMRQSLPVKNKYNCY
jgi:hypothetical protein